MNYADTIAAVKAACQPVKRARKPRGNVHALLCGCVVCEAFDSAADAARTIAPVLSAADKLYLNEMNGVGRGLSVR